MCFGFCKSADENGDLAKTEDLNATALVAFSSDAGVAKVIPRPSKAASPCAIAGMRQFTQGLERGQFRVRADSEPAAKAILEGAVNALQAKVAPELAPKHGGPSNPAGAAVKILEGQARALKAGS